MAAGTMSYLAGVPVAELLDALGAEEFEVGPRRTTALSVLDTFDGRLAEAGERLVAADAAVDGLLTVVLCAPAGDASVRVATLPRIATDLPPGPMRARLAEVLDVRVLLPLLTADVVSTTAIRRNSDDKAVVAVTVTEVDGGAFVEVGELTGYADRAARTRRMIEDLGAVAVAGTLADHLAERDGIDLQGVRIEPGVPLDGEAPAIDGYRIVLANLHEAIAVNRPGTVADVDPEFLHDLRVAVRRTRAILAEAGPVLPGAVRAAARADLRWLGDITSPPRDLDVYQIEWPTYVAELPPGAVVDLEPIRLHLAVERTRAHVALSDALSGPEATRILDGWGDWLNRPVAEDPLPEGAAAPLARVVHSRIRKAHRTMIRRGRTITASTPAAELHELRKDAKKLRYLLECFGGLYAPAARKALVQRLKGLQDNLGEHQDAEVHVDQLTALVGDLASGLPPTTVLAAGRLIERMEQRRAAARHEFAARFARFDSNATRSALRELLESARS